MKRLLCLLVLGALPSLGAIQGWSHSYTYTGGYPGTISTVLTGCATHSAKFVVVTIMSSPRILASNITISTTSITPIANVNEVVNGNLNASIWYGSTASISNSETVTATASGGFSNSTIWAQCYSGVATTSPLDQQNTGTAGDGDTLIPDIIQPGSITPAQSGELIVALSYNQVGTISVDSGFTVVDSDTADPYVGAVASLVQASAGSVNPTLTGSGSPLYSRLVAAVASFKPAAAGAHVSFFPIVM